MIYLLSISHSIKLYKNISKDLVNLINKYQHNKAEHISTIDQAVEFLQDKITDNDVVITIGAGNVFEVANKLKQ